jgi:hypothetical protein
VYGHEAQGSLAWHREGKLGSREIRTGIMEGCRSFPESQIEQIQAGVAQGSDPTDPVERLTGLTPVRRSDETSFSQRNFLAPGSHHSPDPGKEIHLKVRLVEIHRVRTTIPIAELLSPEANVLNLEEKPQAGLNPSIQRDSAPHGDPLVPPVAHGLPGEQPGADFTTPG